LMSRTRRRSRALFAILRSFSRSAFCSGVRSSSSLLLWDRRDATFSNGVGKKKVSKLVLFSSRAFRGRVHLQLLSVAEFYIHLNSGLLKWWWQSIHETFGFSQTFNPNKTGEVKVGAQSEPKLMQGAKCKHSFDQWGYTPQSGPQST